MILAGTGHRLNKLGEGSDREIEAKLRALTIGALEHYQPSKVISGFALGWDLSLAEAAIECKIPLIAAIPCRNQSEMWHGDPKIRHKKYLSQASEVYVLAEFYHPRVMQDRNEWMVDHCDKLLALWNGERQGGTYNCIKYAQKKRKPILSMWEIYKAL